MTDSERYRSGDRIADKYELVRKLDEGGMGAVWAAKNVDLDVHVALKLLRPELAETHAAGRLLAEARMLARLQHPAVVRVHDCGRTSYGDPFVAMELLDGESLADFMARRGRVSSIEAASLLLPVIDGVRAAHEAGIVHRDIKPENIFLAKVGGRTQPKLIDFGIALAEAIAVRRTTHGAVMGSPVYMSPEQARGDQVGASTDLWALSVVLFELVSARLPFEGDNYHAVLRAIIEDEPPSLTQLGAGDELLAAITERGLSKDTATRFQGARELGTALAEWLLGQGVNEDAAHVSLRAGWLTRVSEAPASIQPMVVGPSDRPPGGTPTTVASAVTRVSAAVDTRASVDGLSLTASQAGRRSRRLWVSATLGAVLVLGGGGGLWLRGSTGQRAVSSATPVVSGVPTQSVTVTSTPEAAPTPAADGGAPARVDAPRPQKTERSAPRPAKPLQGFRPRGI